ncbi:MAG TPA: alpha/beta hydrolase [Streptosporangiaceae bacterium]|nr:alpha/beta hydrolase [Streptosporangiaceae bacterium]
MSYADVNGVSLYYEEHGSGRPLILLHGGLGSGDMYRPILPVLAAGRRVITVDLQAHGRTADVDRPLRYETLGDDVAGLIHHLGLGQADVMGYSFGAAAALRTAIQHPDVVRRLVLVSIPCRRDGWYPESLAGMDAMGSGLAGMLMQSPVYETYARVAPRVEDFPVLLDKTGEQLRLDYDWSADVAAISAPVMLVYADADAVRPAHIVEFYALLGGGLRDANWDGSLRPVARLAILPGYTHYDIFASADLPTAVIPFLDAASLEPPAPLGPLGP